MPAKLFYIGPSLGTLHEEYAKKSRIDEQAPLVSAASITIEVPVPEVWAVISDVASWPAWYPPPGSPCWNSGPSARVPRCAGNSAGSRCGPPSPWSPPAAN